MCLAPSEKTVTVYTRNKNHRILFLIRTQLKHKKSKIFEDGSGFFSSEISEINLTFSNDLLFFLTPKTSKAKQDEKSQGEKSKGGSRRREKQWF